MPGSGGNWWPAHLGSPSGSGAQNHVRYAYFNQAHRLAVELNGHVTIYDTLDHHVGGVSQQQGSGSSLTLTSQYGTVPIATLPVVSSDQDPAHHAAAPIRRSRLQSPRPDYAGGRLSSGSEADIFGKIERLADLHKKGILSAEEFAAKKNELLSRL